MSDTWDHEADSINSRIEHELGDGVGFGGEDGLVLSLRGTGRQFLLSSASAPNVESPVQSLPSGELSWKGVPVSQIEPGHAKNIISYITRTNPVLTQEHKDLIEHLAARITGSHASAPGVKRYALLDKDTGEVIEL